MYHQFKQLADVDITSTPMEVGPTMHYMMGGVRVDPDTAASTIPGLFAAGECAGGMHGANRLGGNSLSDLLVFGKRAGEGAAAYAKGLASTPSVDTGEADAVATEVLAHFERDGKENPYAIQQELQETMHALVGIIRTESELQEALIKIRELKERAKQTGVEGNRQYNPGWHLAMDLRSMLAVSEAVTLAAIERKESRGAHTRDDFPQTDAEWGKWNIAVRLTADSDVQVAKEALPEMPAELAELLKEPAKAGAA
jgi:succinate dehydrogenase / fumarate reductase flavoprotein subunit